MLPLLVLSLYGFALYFGRRSRYALALAIILLCGLALKVWACADPWLGAWDERYHALVGKNLSRHFLVPTLYEQPVLPFDYRNWTANHIWLHKQPMALWLIALSVKAFSATAMAVRLPSIVLSSLAVVLTYDIAKRLFNERVALFSAFYCSVNGLLLDLVSGNNNTDHVDVCFLAFVLLSIWLVLRAHSTDKSLYLALAGVSMGLALLTKWLPALLPAGLWLFLAFRRNEKWTKALLQCACLLLPAAFIALPWQWYIFHTFPAEAAWEAAFNAKHFQEAVEGHNGNAFYYMDQLRICYGEAVYIPVIWFACQAYTQKKTGRLFILLWFLVPLIFFSLAATKMPAYTLMAAPAIFIMCGDCTVAFVDFARNGRWRMLSYLVSVSLIALPVRYCIERLKPFDRRENDRKKYSQVMTLRHAMINPPKTIVIHCPFPVELMFHTGCTAYEAGIDQRQADSLVRSGYVVLDFKRQIGAQ